MNPDRDPLDVLAALAPPAADPAVLARAHARTTALRSAPRRRGRRWRGSAAIVAALAFSAGGIGLATADDPVPSRVYDLFASIGPGNPPGAHDGPVPDPSSAERIASVPFDDDHQFSLWRAESGEGWTCLVTVLEPTSGDEWPEDGTYRSCLAPLLRPHTVVDRPKPFAVFITSRVDRGLTHFEATAGETVRAEIQFPDGSVRELVGGAGSYFGWIPDGMHSGVVTGYLPDGTVADRFTVHG